MLRCFHEIEIELCRYSAGVQPRSQANQRVTYQAWLLNSGLDAWLRCYLHNCILCAYLH